MSALTLIQLTPEELRAMIREEVARAAPVAVPAADRILTVAEAAQHARRSSETIRDWIHQGRLDALPRSGRQHIRVRLEDLERAMVAPTAAAQVDDLADVRARIARRRLAAQG